MRGIQNHTLCGESMLTKYELDMAEEACEVLKRHGEARLLYVTAELAPFTSMFKPDLIFKPSSGRYEETYLFVELKILKNSKADINDYEMLLPRNRDWVVESCYNIEIAFAFATDRQVDPIFRASLEEQEIRILDCINDAETLAQEIISWANS